MFNNKESIATKLLVRNQNFSRFELDMLLKSLSKITDTELLSLIKFYREYFEVIILLNLLTALIIRIEIANKFLKNKRLATVNRKMNRMAGKSLLRRTLRFQLEIINYLIFRIFRMINIIIISFFRHLCEKIRLEFLILYALGFKKERKS